MKIKGSFKSILDLFFKQLTELGSFTFFLVTIGLLILLKYYSFALRLSISLGLIMIVAVLIKSIYFKKRPKKHKITNVIERIDASSFPSIHSMRTFALSFWMIQFFNNSFITIYLTILGIFVIYSRIYLKKHYWSDIIGGIFFSFVINIVIWWLLW